MCEMHIGMRACAYAPCRRWKGKKPRPEVPIDEVRTAGSNSAPRAHAHVPHVHTFSHTHVHAPFDAHAQVWTANSNSAGETAQTLALGGLLAVRVHSSCMDMHAHGHGHVHVLTCTCACVQVGSVSKGVKEFVEAIDLFVGRYLLLTTVTYVRACTCM